nr:autotransporter outer membrane beta-barrel domain-containing protein [uncultured Phascolarctobacterium sp.]
MEKFPRKSWRAKLALAVTAGILAASYAPQSFAASYSGNKNVIWGMQSVDSKTFGSNLSIDADGSMVFDFGEAVTFTNSGVASPKGLVNNGDVPGAVVIKNDFTGIMHSKDYAALAIKAGWLEGVANLPADKRGSITFDGNVTLRDKSVEGEWGVTANDLHGSFVTYKGARWQPVGIRAGLCGDVIINGNLDLAVKGSALVTDPYYKAITTSGSTEYADDFKTATITTNGDVNIDTPKDFTEAFYSIANYGGTINVNADATAAGDKTVVINGNILTMRDAGKGEPYFYRTGQTNIGLTNAQSSWTGVVDNTGTAQTGEVNLWLQNNAVWNHKALSLTNGISLGELPALSAPHYDKYDGITHINKLSGGSSDADAGLIFQDNKANIDINNYSGYTTVFYKHDNDGSASADYTAGDVIIRNAEKDSAINMVTDSSKIDTKDSAKLNSVLNALAGKLTYSDYVNNPENLLGTVKIVGGLTNDSVTIKSGKIQFADNGKGSYTKPAVTNFASTLTGDADKDMEYAEADVIQGDGSYKFSNDSSITAVNGIDTAKDLKIDAAGKTLTVTTAGTDSAAIKIFNNGGSKFELTADKLVINSSADYAGKNAGIMAGDWNTTKKNVTVNGDVDITAANTVGNNNYVYGVLASNADVTVNGNLKADVDGGKGGYDHTSDSAVMAQGSSYRKTSSTVTVNGDVDITANGNGLHTNGNGSVITVNGGGAITVNDSSTKGGYAALRAGNGTVNMNVALENGKATAGLGHDVVLKGNLAAVKASDNTASVINVALDTAKSSLEGVSYMTEGNGQINMWLQNGASWTNEVHGSTEKDWKGNSVFNGSKVTSLAGGVKADAAGNIFQKDSNALTIDNYSGNMNIFYEHAGDGVTYNAGDTIIKHAEKGSVVNLITSNKGLTLNAKTINDTLNALAGKLTYTNYKDGERNLDGKVKIAGGLTSDSLTVAMGDILFGSSNGKGYEATNLKVQAPDHQVSTSFNSALTGETEADLEYILGGVVKDGSYKFTEDTSINVSGKDARGMDFAEGATVDASGKTLTINVADGTGLNAGISQNINVDSHVKADKIVIKVDSNDSGKTHAIHQDKGNLIIDGDLDIDVTGKTHTVGVYSHAGSTTINGDVKVKLDGNHGGYAEFGAAGIYAHAGYGGAVGGTINVNGNVDISGVGNGLFANIGGGTINVNGGRIHIIDDNEDTGYSAIYATCGAINMNTVKDEKGNVIGAANNKVDITGNVVISGGAVNYVDCYEYSLVNLGLTTKDSQLTGVIYNEFPDEGMVMTQGSNSKLFTGAANLWLQNGATWTNEQQGTLANVYKGEQFTGSHVAKLTGGTSADTAGNIFQKESGALTIDNYSGNTNIFYEHAGDGVTFNAGDTIIKHAEKDSVVNLITSNKGLNINAETINNTLNALAGKLTYTNYKDGERNLDGKVKIAGGLTSDSVTMAVGDILFNESDGKGSGAVHIALPSAPENQVSTSFNSTLTGDKDKDLEYVLGGVIKDGSYKFTENSAINVSGEGAKGLNLAQGTTIDASGKTLTVNVTDASKGNAGIAQDVDVNSTVKADKLVIKLDSTKSGQGAQAIRQTKGDLTIDSNVDIDVKGDNSTAGVYSYAGSTTINGDVKVVLDGNRGGFNEYGAAGLYAHAGYGGEVGGTINVNGNVDISGVGNGLFANIGGATINVNGGKINVVDDNAKNGYSAIYAGNGKINVNTAKDADGKVTGAGNNKVDITGNIVTSVGSVNYVDCCTETEVNLGLTTKDSKFTGVVYNQFPEGGKTVSQRGDSKLFTGAANLWLQNGATWINEQQGVLPSVWPGQGEQFTGSRVNKLAGGTTAEAAGNIYQNDSNKLTIDNYSGVTNIIYAHGGDGTTFAAGDTIIKHAEAGSVVNMVTSNQGITDISAALNALAGKLTYLNYATANGSERNLTGYVKLAGGLTSDSVTMVTGDILFSEETGKGSGTDNIKFADEPETQTAKSFNSTLTGERLKDLEYVLGGVVKDGSYKFTENSAINVSGEGAKGMNFAQGTTIDASGKTLTVNVTDASKGNAGIAQDVDVNSTIKADKLVIKLDSTKSGKGAQAIRQDKGNLTIDANVDIDVKGDNSTMGVYSHAGSTTINGDVKVKIDGNRGGWGEYGAAGLYAHANYGGAVGGTINVNGNVDISGVGNGLFANIGGATINVNGGKINIVDDNAKNGYSAIYATCGTINMNTVKDANGKVIGAGNNKVDITGNVVVSVGGVNYVDCCTETEVNLGLTTKDSKLTGVVYNQFPEGGKTASQGGNSKLFTGATNMWLQNGATWINEQQGVLPSVWPGQGEQFTGSRVTNLTGGTSVNDAGLIYQKDKNALTIDNLSGVIKVLYDHEFEDAMTRGLDDEKEIVYNAGNTIINNADAGSKVIMATGSNGINTFDKASVEKAFDGLANKLIYKGAEENPDKLKAELQLSGGLTSSNVSWTGEIEWNGEEGSYKLDSAEQTIKLLYDEDVVSKDTRAAIMSSMVGWRNAAADTYSYRSSARTQKVGGGRGPVVSGDAHGEDNEGVWARTWGGQNKYSGNNTSFKNSYWAGQVGYDKTFANGWNVGVALDYMTGDDSYNAGSGDTKTYTLGFYGTKELRYNEFLDLTAKVGRISNDFETKDILGRTVKGDYKATGFSLSGQYSKRFGDEAAGYFEPQLQLTIGRMGSSDFDSTGTLEGHISQDAFTSIVGRLGLEAGQASEHGRYFARLSLSHEFAGDMDTHFSDSSATMSREFNLDGTWCDLTVGGTYELNDRISFYGDVSKTLSGDYKQDWKVNAGLRFTF